MFLFNSILQYRAIVSFQNVAFYIANAVILCSKSPRPHDHISLSQIWESINLEGQVRIFIPQEDGGPVIAQAPGFTSALSPVTTPASLFHYKSKSKLFYDRRSVGQSALLSGHHLGPVTIFFFLEIVFRQLQVCYCGVPSLSRGRAYNLQLLLDLASAVFLGSQFRRTHGLFFLPHIWGSLHLEGQVPLFVSPRNKLTKLYRLLSIQARYSICSLVALYTGYLENTASSSYFIVTCVFVPEGSFI
jgi:hypothetical protein